MLYFVICDMYPCTYLWLCINHTINVYHKKTFCSLCPRCAWCS